MSGGNAMSPDGRYVAFQSKAGNLVPGDTNNGIDVFVHDRLTGETERVSVDSSGNQGNSSLTDAIFSATVCISASGRYVAFTSDASNLVLNDSNGVSDVFVHDRSTGATERVSVDSAGNQANGASTNCAMSAEGRYVAFESTATNLVPGDTNGKSDVFVHDRLTGSTQRVSISSAGFQGDADSYTPSVSADGRFVVFASLADNLVTGDTNGAEDIFLHDILTGLTQRVSLDSGGDQANDDSVDSFISADGTQVGFTSSATNLVPGDTNGVADVFVYNRLTGATKRISTDSLGTQGNDWSGFVAPSAGGYVALSADGRYAAFASAASNLVAGDTNAVPDVFVSSNCSQALCGDGILDFRCGEQCDDGNSVSGDGCSSTCAVENGFSCEGEPSVCTPFTPTPTQTPTPTDTPTETPTHDANGDPN